MNTNTEDRLKGDCTPLMEAASAGHVDIVNLLISHGADVNAQSNSGNTPLMYGCAGGHEEVVKVLLDAGANVEDHNENGHTPLMEAASAGHVSVAKILLEHGAGINTHSNEFKESALTLACYKGHLDMVRFLLEAGADQEHKTDEMHTALMEASMDGHVEVARLLLDSGAQVNMPTDSFESPLTLAACGGHVDLAMLLIERGANIEEVNDEGYTPLMEAAREGHEEMVALLLSQGANINAQTEETQETALTLACCGGFLEVADFLIKAGADVELGASTPLMEAAQEGHLELVRYLLESSADVHAQTQTGDTALTYACENGHTDVADLLLQFGADLEHESEGGRTPLMKACRAGHLCTVQFLLSKNADVNRQTTNNDHTPLSLACAGGHLSVVELLLAQSADPFYKLKDNSTMLIEAAKGGHTSVVQLLLDYPHSIMMNQTHNSGQPALPNQLQNNQQPAQAAIDNLQQTQETQNQCEIDANQIQIFSPKACDQNSASKINRLIFSTPDAALNTAEIQQIRNQPRQNVAMDSNENVNVFEKTPLNISNLIEPDLSSESPPERDSLMNNSRSETSRQEQILQKQQILEELQRVERELQMKGAGHLFLQPSGTNPDFTINSFEIENMEENVNLSNSIGVINTEQIPQPTSSASDFSIENSKDTLNAFMNYQEANRINTALSFYKGFQANKYYIEGFKEGMKIEKQRMLKEVRCLQETQLPLPLSSSVIQRFPITNTFTNNATVSVITVPAPTAMGSINSTNSCNTSVNLTYSNPSFSNDEFCKTISAQPLMPIASCEVSQNAAISDRPKVKAIPKKDNKNARKTVQGMVINKLQQQHMALMAGLSSTDFQKFLEKTRPHCVQQVHQLQQLNQQLQSQLDQVQLPSGSLDDNADNAVDSTKQYLDGICSFFNASERNISTSSDEGLKLEDEMQTRIDETAHIFESLNLDDINKDDSDDTKKIEVLENLPLQNTEELEENATASDSLDSAKEAPKHINFLGFGGIRQTAATSPDTLPKTLCSLDQPDIPVTPQTLPSPAAQSQKLDYFEIDLTPEMRKKMKDDNSQANLLPQSNQLASTTQTATTVACLKTTELIHSAHDYTQSNLSNTNQVQVATQTQSYNNNKPTVLPMDKKSIIASSTNLKGKKTKYLLTQQQASSPETSVSSHQSSSNFLKQNFHVDPKSDKYTIENPAGKFPPVAAATTTTTAATPPAGANQPASVPFSCMDVDSETDSNHDTALTLACAGGHEELVELLLSRGSDIEHRDKKGFTPLILAATAGHQKVVEILLNHGADIEAQSERTKDTPLSLACSGGRYEVVELLLTRGANKEHRNVSDYTPLSLAASGGYVNIIKLLLSHGAEINSRTGSKLGISPLMLAAMNGHTAAVKLLLDMGSDINAQIETNRNTALTLACFQGRHEVVSLLLDRKANVEHRAKTGLTPLMEAASGGYVEVGRVLLNKGADVNATPVPSSRDTALTIAADKGHCRFVELLLSRGTQVEVKNKKGNSPLWLAANGGHLSVVDLLFQAGADIDSQDNRKVSCLMAAFRKGHIKVVKWMVNHVTQFPSDQEMTRYIATINDKELLERCHECVKVIRDAKETQAAKANKNATILLEELDMEKTREESKKAAAARKRERKKKKKLEKKEEKRKLQQENEKNEAVYENKFGLDNKTKSKDDSDNDDTSEFSQYENSNLDEGEKSADETAVTNQSGSSVNSAKTKDKKKEKKKKKSISCNSSSPKETNNSFFQETVKSVAPISNDQDSYSAPKSQELERHPAARDDFEATGTETSSTTRAKRNHYQSEASHSYTVNTIKYSNSTVTKPGKRDEGWKEVVRKGQTDDSGKFTSSSTRSRKVSVPANAISRVIGRGGSNINTIRTATGAHIEVDKQNKTGGERIITIRGSAEANKQAYNLITALIKDPEIDIVQFIQKSTKISTVTTSWDQTFSSTNVSKLKVSSPKPSIGISTSGFHIQGSKPNYISSTANILPFRTQTSIKPDGSSTSRVVTPRFVSAAENKTMAQAFSPCNTKTTMSYTSAIMTSNHTMKNASTIPQTTQSFAAKLTDSSTIPQGDPSYPNANQSNHISTSAKNIFKQNVSSTITTVVSSMDSSSKVSATQSNVSTLSNTYTTSVVIPPTPMTVTPHFSEKLSHEYNLGTFITSGNSVNPAESFTSSTVISNCTSSSNPDIVPFRPFSTKTRTFSPFSMQPQEMPDKIHSQYSLFDDTFSKVTQQSMWGTREHEIQKKSNFADVAGVGISMNSTLTIPENTSFLDPSSKIDLSKAPGYRGTSVYSPTSNNPKNINVPDGKMMMDAPISSSNTIQSANFQPSVGYNRNDPIMNSSVNLEVSPNFLPQKDVNLNPNKLPYAESVIHKTMDGSQNMINDYRMCNISPVSQNNLEENMYDENSLSYEFKKEKLKMMKNISNDMTSNAKSLSGMQQNMQHHPQTVTPSTVMTTISMSQLNPRAPDFSSSLHPNPKTQANMYDRDATLRQQMYPKMPPQAASNSIQNVRNQNRWSYATQFDYLPKDPNLGQLSYHNSYETRNMDMNNPDKNMLSSHVVVPMKNSIEHRRVQPRPIGTERSWKNYPSYTGPGGDADVMNWSDEALANPWSGLATLDHSQMFANVPFNQIPPQDPNQTPIMDSTLQGSRFKN